MARSIKGYPRELYDALDSFEKAKNEGTGRVILHCEDVEEAQSVRFQFYNFFRYLRTHESDVNLRYIAIADSCTLKVKGTSVWITDIYQSPGIKAIRNAMKEMGHKTTQEKAEDSLNHLLKLTQEDKE